LPYDDYYLKSNGFHSKCKECFKRKQKTYARIHSKTVAESRKKYYYSNREKILEDQKNYREMRKLNSQGKDGNEKNRGDN